MEPLLEGLLRSLGGSEANFLEVCLARIPYGNFHAKANTKKSGRPSGNFCPNRPPPPQLPRSPSRSFPVTRLLEDSLTLGAAAPDYAPFWMGCLSSHLIRVVMTDGDDRGRGRSRIPAAMSGSRGVTGRSNVSFCEK